MTIKKSILALIVTAPVFVFMLAGCSAHGKYYSSKSKQYKKLKRRYEKYDCGCDIGRDTIWYDRANVHAEAAF
jgi:hypothetical protein